MVSVLKKQFNVSPNILSGRRRPNQSYGLNRGWQTNQIIHTRLFVAKIFVVVKRVVLDFLYDRSLLQEPIEKPTEFTRIN